MSDDNNDKGLETFTSDETLLLNSNNNENIFLLGQIWDRDDVEISFIVISGERPECPEDLNKDTILFEEIIGLTLNENQAEKLLEFLLKRRHAGNPKEIFLSEGIYLHYDMKGDEKIDESESSEE